MPINIEKTGNSLSIIIPVIPDESQNAPIGCILLKVDPIINPVNRKQNPPPNHAHTSQPGNPWR